MNRPMSQQLTFSATVCVLTMALFAITHSPAMRASDANDTIAQPIGLNALAQR